MLSKYELLYLVSILYYYEPGIVSIIKYYINTYTFKNNTELKSIVWSSNNIRDECLNKYGHISYWECFKITDMSRLFYLKQEQFNEDLSRWNTSNVITMEAMFYFAKSFNRPIRNWDTSNVTNMCYIFNCAKCFNQPLNNWDVSNVTNMKGMFHFTEQFNQPLNSWNVSNTTNMTSMFDRAISFNQSLNSWNVSNVTDMNSMFINSEMNKNNIKNWKYHKDILNKDDMFSKNYHIDYRLAGSIISFCGVAWYTKKGYNVNGLNFVSVLNGISCASFATSIAIHLYIKLYYNNNNIDIDV